jgi:hypothetical protein
VGHMGFSSYDRQTNKSNGLKDGTVINR